jgi:hypothetical protein
MMNEWVSNRILLGRWGLERAKTGPHEARGRGGEQRGSSWRAIAHRQTAAGCEGAGRKGRRTAYLSSPELAWADGAHEEGEEEEEVGGGAGQRTA